MAWIDSSALLADYLDSRLIGRLSVDDETPDDPVTPNESYVVTHLVRAKNVIEDSISVGGRYSVPLEDTEVSELIRHMQAMFTAESLFQRRFYDVPESLQAQIDRSQKMLDDIRGGAVIPGLLDEAGANANQRVTLGKQNDRKLSTMNIGYFPPE